MTNRRLPTLAALAVIAFVAAACDGGGTYEITETRTLPAPRASAAPADARARLLPSGPAAAFPRFDGTPAGAPSAAGTGPGATDSPLRWTVPDGWTEGPARQMRVATFVPAGTTGVECYVTLLAGNGGGLAANVNRWRQQIGLAAATPAEIDGLATLDVLGVKARLVEITSGANGVLGLVAETGAQTIFVKMTGPADVLKSQRERFLAFCRSLS